MTQFSMRSSGLLLPVSGKQSRTIRAGEFDIIGENGQVTWVNRDTGRSSSRTPEDAIMFCNEMFSSLVGNSPTKSQIAGTHAEQRMWEKLLQDIVELAKEQQVVQARNVERALAPKVF